MPHSASISIQEAQSRNHRSERNPFQGRGIVFVYSLKDCFHASQSQAFLPLQQWHNLPDSRSGVQCNGDWEQKKCKRNNVIQVADYLHLIKEGTVPVAEEGLSKCTYAYLYAWGNGGKEWHHVGFLIGRVGKAKTPATEPSSVLEMLQESVGGSWMAVLDEQRPRSYQPPVA